MSSRKKIRQAPGRLLRQKLVISVRCVARVETLPLKGPRLLIRHWILYTEKSHTQTCLLRLPGGCLHPTRQQSQRPEGLSTKYNFVYYVYLLKLPYIRSKCRYLNIYSSSLWGMVVPTYFEIKGIYFENESMRILSLT
jgi:hypothetical protein